MSDFKFDKEAFKKEVKNNVKTLYRRTIDEATPQQTFQAVSYAVKEYIIDNWLATQEVYEKRITKDSVLSVDGIFDGKGTRK